LYRNGSNAHATGRCRFDGRRGGWLASHFAAQEEPAIPGSLACTYPLAGAGFGGRIQGPGDAGAALLDVPMAHLTQPQFVYVHEGVAGDLVI